MNYFIDLSTFSRFYTVKNEDEKPPPDLKSTSGQIEERKIKKGRRRKETPEKKDKTPLEDETMGSAPRKEKTSWPDWQFWKRSDGSGGPFGAFRKSAKSTGTFTFRKDINDTIGKEKSDVKNERASAGLAINVGHTTAGKKAQEFEVRGPAREGELEKDQPLVSYMKEFNGSKHVVINMSKIETLAGGKSGEACQTTGEIASSIMEEKCSPIGPMANSVKISQTPQRSTDAGVRTLMSMNDIKAHETKMAPGQQNSNNETNGFLHFPAGQHKSGTPGKIYSSRTSNGKVVQQQFNVVASNVSREKKQLAELNHKETGSKIREKTAKHVRVEATKPSLKAGDLLMTMPPKQSLDKIDEKPSSNQVRNEVDAAKPNGSKCSFKTIKSSVIPLPRLNAKEVAEKKQADSKANIPVAKGACVEQGRLHTVLKKVNESWRPGTWNSTQNSSAPAPIQTKFPAQNSVLSDATDIAKAKNNQPDTRPQKTPKSKNYAAKKQGRPSQNATNRINGTSGKVRANGSQKSTATGTSLLNNTGKASRLNDNGRQHVSKAIVRQGNRQIEQPRHPNNLTEPKTKSPIMKDASTATPTPRAKIDAKVQFPEEDEPLDASDVSINITDETESLLTKRPWDTERVLKMQVLLDEKQVEIGQLKDAGKRQRDELKAFKRRCEELEEVIRQANMEGKPQLVIQINELTEIKNELLTEVSKLTVDIERERTNVKSLKTELVDVKGQLTAARKKNGNLA